jgi:hypothetical protein
MSTALRMAFRDPCTKGCLGLTGGRDSRLILALLRADGLADDIECQTLGAEDLPDVVVARQLATLFGLRHVTAPGLADRLTWRLRVNEAVRNGELANCPPREIAFRLTAWVTSGLCNAGEPHLGRLPPEDKLLLSGLFGESLRTNYPATGRFRSKRDVARFPENLKVGSAEILAPDAMTAYRAELHDLLFEGAISDDSPQDVIDSFYLRQRVRHWLGNTMEVDSEGRAFPLYSITGMRLAFAIGAEARHAQWIHHQLIRAAVNLSCTCPSRRGTGSLAAVASRLHRLGTRTRYPILRRYCARVTSSMTRLANLRRHVLPPASSPRHARWEGSLARPSAAPMSRSCGSSSARIPPIPHFSSSIRARRCVQSISSTSCPKAQRMQVYGALAAVIWLGGHEVPLPRELSAA